MKYIDKGNFIIKYMLTLDSLEMCMSTPQVLMPWAVTIIVYSVDFVCKIELNHKLEFA